MLKLTQLKYPSFPVKVTNSQATVGTAEFNSGLTNQFMYRETCYFSSDYEEELRSLTDPVKMMEQTKVIQFPFNQPVR